jgi:uncharacterized membrane protein
MSNLKKVKNMKTQYLFFIILIIAGTIHSFKFFKLSFNKINPFFNYSFVLISVIYLIIWFFYANIFL